MEKALPSGSAFFPYAPGGSLDAAAAAQRPMPWGGMMPK
jgi:hypothetical protein